MIISNGILSERVSVGAIISKTPSVYMVLFSSILVLANEGFGSPYSPISSSLQFVFEVLVVSVIVFSMTVTVMVVVSVLGHALFSSVIVIGMYIFTGIFPSIFPSTLMLLRPSALNLTWL